MNWTGGRLSRHSSTKGSLRTRQKQHFAKVQARLRGGTKKLSPLKFSFIENSTEGIADNLRTQSVSDLSRYRHESQPVQSLRSNPHDAPAALYGESDHESPSCEHHNDQKSDELLVEQRMTSIPDDDLYNATPLSRGRKRKRKLSEIQLNAEMLQGQEEESESERRRRILRKGDWVGVNVQRPLQLAFASPDHMDLVGRRRKVTDGHRAQYSHNMRKIVTSPFDWQTRIHFPRDLGGRRQDTAHLGRSDVRISIGGRAVPPGIGSSSARSWGRAASVRSSLLEQSQTSSSDFMLLDNEGVARVYKGERSQSLATDIGDGRYQSKFGNASQTLDWPGVYNSKSSESRRVKQWQPIVSSSTTSLRHPRPRSSRTSLLIRSDSSDIPGSIVAQVGNVKPVVPSSQAADNEIWESWVGPILNEPSPLESNGLQDYIAKIAKIPISPGAGHVPIFRPAHRRIPSDYTNDSSSDGLQSSIQSNVELSEKSTSRHFLPSDEGRYEGESISSEADIDGRHGLSINRARSSADNLKESRSNHAIKDADQPVKAVEESDPDSIWRKFVFGNSGDGD